MHAAPSRYQFDLDFDAEKRLRETVEEDPTISLYEHEAEMAALERRVRAEAHKAGRQEAMDEGARELAQEAQRLTGVASTMLTRLDQEIGIREERAVRIALSAAKKLARRLLAQEPHGEIEALFRTCLAPMFDASHLVVRMNEAHVDAIREKLKAVAAAQGFEGRLVFMGEEGFAPGDARIDWADGGLARSQDELETLIDTLIEDYLAARPGTGAPARPREQTYDQSRDGNNPSPLEPGSMEGAFDEH
jgi:flagellar assembly protein FliH